jgi:hypothetical protein
MPKRLTDNEERRKWTELRQKWNLVKSDVTWRNELCADKLVSNHPLF